MPEGSDSLESFAEIYEKVRCALHGQIVCTCCELIAASTLLLVQEYADRLAEIAEAVSSLDSFEKYFTRTADGF